MFLILSVRPSLRGGLTLGLIMGNMGGSSTRGACIRFADVGRPGVIEHRDVTALGSLGRKKSWQPGLAGLGMFAVSRPSRFACLLSFHFDAWRPKQKSTGAQH